MEVPLTRIIVYQGPSLLGVPIIRIIVYQGLFWGPSFMEITISGGFQALHVLLSGVLVMSALLFGVTGASIVWVW